MGIVFLYATASVIFAIFTVLTWKYVRGETGSRYAEIVFCIVMTGLSVLNTTICAVMTIVEWWKL